MFGAIKEVKIDSIVVMPDFFVDRIIRLSSQEEFYNLLAEKVKFGGGAIRNIVTTKRKDGNAVNVAYCLAKLGVRKTTLLTVADELGSAMLQKVFSKFGDSINLRIEHGKHGRTTGLEFLGDSDAKANVMLNDAGDNEFLRFLQLN
jgi:ribokinase